MYRKIILIIAVIMLCAAPIFGGGNIELKWGGLTEVAYSTGYTAAGGYGVITAASTQWHYYTDIGMIDLAKDGYEGAAVTVSVNGGGNDTIDVGVFPSLGASGGNQDYSPTYSFTVDANANPITKTFFIRNIPYFGVGFRNPSTNDDFHWAILYNGWYWYYN